MSKPVLEVTGLKKYFPIRKGIFYRKVGDVKAVDNISFDVKEGEIFGLVGESGCGKSTTGRTLLRLLEPSAGRVSYRGRVLFDMAKNERLPAAEMQALRQDMQMIFQDPFASLDPRWTIGRIVMEGMLQHKICSRKEAMDRAKALLESCGIAAANVSKYPHEFSGGQRQRIGIARAIALNPSFMVGDEPIAALDVSIQAQVLILLQKLIREMNLTFLFISHDLNVVRYFCDRIAVMYLGSFVELGSSQDLFQEPLHPYSQALLSAIPEPMPGQKRQRIILTGDVPSPANPPSGCKFHTRCRHAMPICKRVSPELTELRKGHMVACHLYQEAQE